MSTPRKPDERLDDEVWDAVAQDQLSKEELGFLKALADADPTLAEHPAAYAPLSAQASEQIFLKAQTSLARHRRTRRNLLFGAAGGVLAVAAAVLLMVRGDESSLPAYALRVSHGLTEVRGAESAAAIPRFDEDTELDIVAVPASRVKGDVEARAYLVRGSEIVPLGSPLRTQEGGALRWKGPASQLLRRGPGRFELAIIVGKELPDEAETRRWVKQRSPKVLFQTLEYLGPEARLEGPDGETFATLEKARAAGELARAQHELALLLQSRNDDARTRALVLKARLTAQAGNVEQAVRELDEASRAARAAGFDKRALDAALVRADWLRRKLFRLRDAEAALAAVERDFRQFPAVPALVAYQRAACAADRGDVRRALLQLDLVLEQAVAQPGDADLRVAAMEVKAPLLSVLGRTREAETLLRGAGPLVGGDPCEQGSHLTNLAWLSILAAERQEGAVDQAALTRAHALFTGPCPRPGSAQNAAVNLALAAVLAGDAEAAQEWLETAEHHGQLEPMVASWRIDVAGRLALQHGDAARARVLYGELEARTNVAGEAADRWRAASGLARADRAAGNIGAARLAYQRAERALDEETTAIPFHAGRETFAGARDASARELAALELARGDTGSAYAVLRKARARALRHLSLHDRLSRLEPAQRDQVTRGLEQHLRARSSLDESQAQAFTAPLDEVATLERTARNARNDAREALDGALAVLGPDALEEPAHVVGAGELVLSFFPLESDWVAFAETTRGVRSARVADPRSLPAEGLLDVLLAPFEAELAGAALLRFMPYADLRTLDLHALPYRGVPLIERLPVVYGADLPDIERERSRRALVVSDPRGNLGKAREEGRSVAAELKRTGASVTLLEGDQATRAAVEASLDSADLLHVAAHAEGPGEHERLGAILLAGEARWEVGDVLALKNVPRQVVLSTCEGALEPGETRAPGLGLAQAFLVRGAQQVVASTRRVPDVFAREFALALYEAPGDDLAARFQGAVRAVRAHDPAAEHWKSYRTWVR